MRSTLAQGLDRLLFEKVTAQLKAKAITVKTGTLVDATIIASTSESDDDARWVKPRESEPFTASRPMSEPMPIPPS